MFIGVNMAFMKANLMRSSVLSANIHTLLEIIASTPCGEKVVNYSK